MEADRQWYRVACGDAANVVGEWQIQLCNQPSWSAANLRGKKVNNLCGGGVSGNKGHVHGGLNDLKGEPEGVLVFSYCVV